MGEAALPQGYYRSDGLRPARYVLRRRSETVADRADYVLEEPILYVHWDGRSWVVPDPARPAAEFVTDLASIPKLAAWLVPKDGRHTPAALVHDAMILAPGEVPNYRGRHDGTPVTAEDADEIFRAGMHYLGVKFVRRWLMWAAVSVRTLLVDGGPTAWVRLVALPLLFVYGVLAVPDVLDVPGEVGVPGPWVLSWSAPGLVESSVLAEIGRAVGWVLVAAALNAAVWGRRWRFGLVSGLAVPVLAFPMVVPAIAYGAYLAIEELIALGLLAARAVGIAHQPVVASRVSRALVEGAGGDEPRGGVRKRRLP